MTCDSVKLQRVFKALCDLRIWICILHLYFLAKLQNNQINLAEETECLDLGLGKWTFNPTWNFLLWFYYDTYDLQDKRQLGIEEIEVNKMSVRHWSVHVHVTCHETCHHQSCVILNPFIFSPLLSLPSSLSMSASADARRQPRISNVRLLTRRHEHISVSSQSLITD